MSSGFATNTGFVMAVAKQNIMASLATLSRRQRPLAVSFKLPRLDPPGLARWGRWVENSLAIAALLAMAAIPVAEAALRSMFATGIPGCQRSRTLMWTTSQLPKLYLAMSALAISRWSLTFLTLPV